MNILTLTQSHSSNVSFLEGPLDWLVERQTAKKIKSNKDDKTVKIDRLNVTPLKDHQMMALLEF